MSPKETKTRSGPPLVDDLSQALADLGLEAASVSLLDAAAVGSSALLSTVAPGELPTEERLTSLREAAHEKLTADGHLLVHLSGRRTSAELARWRDGLWPNFHVGARYVFDPSGGVTRVLLQGETSLSAEASRAGSIRVGELLSLRPTEHV